MVSVFGHGNPMYRASEKKYVSGMTQIGIRNVSSTAREGYIEAKKRGSQKYFQLDNFVK